ncbi:MAG: esterase-like activity of phytase family protein [Kiloniellaceae bacterium]
MQSILRAAILALFAGLPNAHVAADPLPLSAQAVELDPDAPERTRVGRLAWRGGLELSSPEARFGGLSGLLVAPDGSEITAVTDKGFRVSARLTYDDAGRLLGVTGGRIAPLDGLDGAPLRRRWDRDAESLARLADGSVVVAFEHNHRLWRYPAGARPLAGTPAPLPAPPGLRAAGGNSGVEALVGLGDGALLAIVEGRTEDRQSPAYLRRGGAWSGLRYRRSGAFRPTGAARLPGGGALVIERRFNAVQGIAIRLRRLPAAAIRPGATLDGEALAVLEPPLTVDNFEGVAVRRGANGETLIYLVSDDNFNPLQRTLLVLFALAE